MVMGRRIGPVIRSGRNHPDGTAALPGIRFAGDTDSGFFSQADNVVSTTLGGVERLRYGVAAFAFQEATTIHASGNRMIVRGGAATNDYLDLNGGTTSISGITDVRTQTGGVDRFILGAAAITGQQAFNLTTTVGAITINPVSGSNVALTTAGAGDIVLTVGTGSVQIANATPKLTLGTQQTFGTTQPTNCLVLYTGTAPAGAITTSVGLFTDGTSMRKIIAAGTVSNVET